MILEKEFNMFIENISLGDKQRERIDSATEALTSYLANYYKISSEKIFLQGSYPNETGVKPAPSQKDGEYDVDLVAICASPDASSDEALNDLEAALSKSADYVQKIEKDKPKKPCVRLRYADEAIGGFHVDIVPARESKQEGLPLEIPRRGEGWHGSAPQEYTEWCLNQGDKFTRTVKIFKRWRDENQGIKKEIKSIVLQVLIAQELCNDPSDAACFLGTLTNIQAFLTDYTETPPTILNPVLPEENLTEQWDAAEYEDFRKSVDEGIKLARQAFDERDANRSAELWRQLFGDSFPASPREESISAAVSYTLADTIHHEDPLQRWRFSATPVPLKIRATIQTVFSKSVHQGRKPFNRVEQIPVAQAISSGAVVPTSKKIYYTAEINIPKPFTVFWQVVNTGSHAASYGKRGLRGNIFMSGDKGGKLLQEESTLYHGLHWIECYIVKDGICIAHSDPFYIQIVPKTG
jgi:hypothetical protein